jgi:hypothetical protein
LKSGQDPNLVKQNILINKQVDQLNTHLAQKKSTHREKTGKRT